MSEQLTMRSSSLTSRDSLLSIGTIALRTLCAAGPTAWGKFKLWILFVCQSYVENVSKMPYRHARAWPSGCAREQRCLAYKSRVRVKVFYVIVDM